MYLSGTLNAKGACPGCGCDVAKRHARTPAGVQEEYACNGCGTFRYGTLRSTFYEMPSTPGAEPVVLAEVDALTH